MQPDCTSRPGSLWRALAALLLAACVLAGQSGVATHALGHALSDIAVASHAMPGAGDDASCADGDDAGGERGSCPLHALFTQLASMAVGQWTALVVAAGVAKAPVLVHAQVQASPGVPFRSRAPPALTA